jgi:hypothetical protein
MWCRGQISGVCNHTLGGGSDSDIGYRGQSIGFKMIVGQASERASLLACIARSLVCDTACVRVCTGLGANNDLEQGAAAVHGLHGGRWQRHHRELQLAQGRTPARGRRLGSEPGSTAVVLRIG